MPTMVFNYDEDKIKKLDELSEKEHRTRSSYIQKVLLSFLGKTEIEPEPKPKPKPKPKKRKTIKIKKK